VKPKQRTRPHFNLEHVLDTPAKIRVLRLLCAEKHSMSAAQLAEQARLCRQTVWNSLRALQKTGVVQQIGTGASLHHKICAKHHLSRQLNLLFGMEDEYFTAFDGAVRSVARSSKLVVSVWEARTRADHVELGILVRAPHELVVADSMERGLARRAQQLGVRIQVKAITIKQMQRHRPSGIRMIYGRDPRWL
jgi:hypothetical protein